MTTYETKIKPEGVDIKVSDKETVIFESKDGEGKIYPGTPFETSIQVPKTESMLGLLSRNPDVRDGDHYKDDGWVYNGGVKRRKWFSHMEGWKHFWAPVLDNPVRLEAVYYKLKLRQDARYKRLWEHVQKIMDTTKSTKGKWDRKAWLVHAQPYRPENQMEGKCWLYDIHYAHDLGDAPSYTMDWVDIPNKFRHLELGNKMYHLERMTRGTMRWGMEQALDAAFRKYLKEKYPNWQKMQAGTMFEIRVNGRHYVYRLEYNRYGVLWLEKHVWAGEQYHIVEIK